MSEFVAIIIKGGIVMVPLLACSLMSLALTLERLIFWGRLRSRRIVEDMLGLAEEGEFNEAIRVGSNSPHPIARVLAAGLAHRNPAPAKAMEAAAQAQIPVLKSRLGVLDTIITLAPLLGLLGTVVGMIGSFDIMSEAGMGQPHAITGGVAEALIATATGLLIAILTLIPYNYFNSRAEKELDAMEHFSSSLELLLHEQAEVARAKLESELELAARIQADLFPASLPRLAGYDVAAANRPARRCGGDYYDALPVVGADGVEHVLFCVADVSGKGLPASLLMSNMQATLRALHGRTPSLPALGAEASALLYATTAASRYVTAALLDLVPSTGDGTFVGAGHIDNFVLKADGSFVRLSSTGMPRSPAMSTRSACRSRAGARRAASGRGSRPR